MAKNEVQLLGGGTTNVVQVGDTVRRTASPWSLTVLALLKHLEAVGFSAAPRPLGNGFDELGRELLAFVPGASPHPAPWSDDAIAKIGSLLRDLHDATATFDVPPSAHWQGWYGRTLGDGVTISHGDLAPWNILASDGLPTCFIDWDTAGPLDPIYELAQVSWLNVQLYDDDLAELLGLGSASSRAGQVKTLLDAYRLPAPAREGLVDKMVEYSIQSACNEAIEANVSEAEAKAITDDGFPTMWAITWRARSAAWMLSNRRLLERAIT